LEGRKQSFGPYQVRQTPLQDEYAQEDSTAPSGPFLETKGSIAFGAASGAYAVQTNGGGYRVDAASPPTWMLGFSDEFWWSRLAIARRPGSIGRAGARQRRQ
jgi:hypothetical protein